MDYTQLIYIAIIMFSCSVFQSSIGFGFALIALPLMLMFDIPLPEITVTIAVCSLSQRFLSVIKLRSHINWKEILPVIAMSFIGIPIGIQLLKILAMQSNDVVRQYIGVIVACALIIMYFSKTEPKDKIHPAWAYMAGFFSGIMAGLAGIGGPPLIFWIYCHKWHNEKLRVLTMAISIPMTVVRLGLMLYTFGNPIIIASLKGFMVVPIVIAGVFIGLKIGKMISPKTLKIFAYGFLGILCAYMIFKPYII